LSTIQGIRVTILRAEAKVPYPNAYASAESIAAASGDKKMRMYIFNCAQRAHQNYLENLPILLTGVLVGGLRHPLIAVGLGVGWMVFRIVYFIGYTRTDKKDGIGRMQGASFWAFQFSLLGLLAKTAFDFVWAK
jgi:glutathione S-transferase